MTKVNEVIKYFEDLYSNGAIYIWGANGEVVTKELCDTLYKIYGNAKYNKEYYNERAKYTGKIGADCSGAFRPVSGFDATAWNYYELCTVKGSIKDIDKKKPCLVFKHSGTSITHIGFYLGDGNTIEMKSSDSNCVKMKLSRGTWTHFGIPSWIDYSDYKPEARVNCSKLNLRNNGTTNSNVIGVLNEGAELNILEEKDGWYKVNVTGWVSSKYVS